MTSLGFGHEQDGERLLYSTAVGPNLPAGSFGPLSVAGRFGGSSFGRHAVSFDRPPGVEAASGDPAMTTLAGQ